MAFLFLAAMGAAAFVHVGSDDDDTSETDTDGNGGEPVEVITGTDGTDVLSGVAEGDGITPAETAPVRIEAGAGDDVLAGDNGDVLSGGAGTDLFEIVIGDDDADPVIIEDLDFALDDLEDQPDRVVFVNRAGQVVSYRGVLEAGLIAEASEDGTGADLYYNDRHVATILGQDADVLNTQSVWVANFSPAVVSRLEGDDILIGDLYDNKDDYFEGAAGDDVIVGGDGTDYLDGGLGNDRIDAREISGPSEDFDLVSGGAGDDILTGDDGDYLVDVRLEDGLLVPDSEGNDIFRVVISDSAEADPVVLVTDVLDGGLVIGDNLQFIAPDGSDIPADDLAANLVVEEVSDYDALAYLYDGRVVAVALDTGFALNAYEAQFGDTTPPTQGDAQEDGNGAEVSAAAATATANAAQRISFADFALGGVDATGTLDIDVTGATFTGNIVSDGLFGANAVYKVNTDQGDPIDTFIDAVQELDQDHIRFPAGQGDGQDAADDRVEWLNVVKMVRNEDGARELRPELTDFLDWARDPDGDGDTSDAKMVTLVIPTKFLDTEDYEDFAPQIQRFTEAVMTDYGDVVHAFEIGNEYWEMGETAYATKANIAIDAILKGLDAAGVAAEDEPQIIVQMATPNAGSEFHVSVDDRGFLTRVEAANQQIIDTLDAQSKQAIDGVIEHYYYNEKLDIFERGSFEVNNIDVDYAVWDENFDKDLDLYLTEWNLKTTNLAQNGLKYTGAFSEQMEYAVTLGADTAHIWAIQHNTTTDLAGASGDSVLLDDEGRMVNTVRSATYELMRESLPGMENLALDYTGADGTVEINGYHDDDKMVFYVASRVAAETHIDLDLSSVLPEFESAKAVRVSMDQTNTSSDGVHFVQGEGKVEAPYLIVGGERFYYGEHDTRGELTDYEVDSTQLEFDLRPYEMVELTFYLSDSDGSDIGDAIDDRVIHGTSRADDLAGGEGDDLIYGQAGNDKLTGDLGADGLYGGEGNDRLYGWGGDDLLEGGEGNDKLSGNQGDDVLKGQKGADTLIGAKGDDELNGGVGWDTIQGGEGADKATGWTGHDTFVYAEDEISTGDTIEDFTVGEDVIELDFEDVTSVDDLVIKANHGDDGGFYVTVAGHGTILVKGDFTYRQLLNPANFVFA
ncbi:calcium-binding protein [Marinibacterium sp. SX1]|uniref:calcium-binding protein n=1 Tax=Marinibacterium sp. SX1 TaxID=3388424 RepID=UPI003D1790DB